MPAMEYRVNSSIPKSSSASSFSAVDSSACDRVVNVASAYKTCLYTSSSDNDSDHSSYSGLESASFAEESIDSGTYSALSTYSNGSSSSRRGRGTTPGRWSCENRLQLHHSGLSGGASRSLRPAGGSLRQERGADGLGNFISSRSAHGGRSSWSGSGESVDSRKLKALLSKWKSETQEEKQAGTNDADEDSGDGDTLDSSSIDSGLGAEDDEWWHSSDDENKDENKEKEQNQKTKKKHKKVIKARVSNLSSQSVHVTPLDGGSDPNRLHEMLGTWSAENKLNKDDYSVSVTSASTTSTARRDNTAESGGGKRSKSRRSSRSDKSTRSHGPVISVNELLDEDDNDSLTKKKNPLRRLNKEHMDDNKRSLEVEQACIGKEASDQPREKYSQRFSLADKSDSSQGEAIRQPKTKHDRRFSLTDKPDTNLLGPDQSFEPLVKSVSRCKSDGLLERGQGSEHRCRSVTKERHERHRDRSRRSEHRSRFGTKQQHDSHLDRSKRSGHRSRSVAKERHDGHHDRSSRSGHRSQSVAKGRSIDNEDSNRRSVAKGRSEDSIDRSKRSEHRSRSVAKGRSDDNIDDRKRSEHRRQYVAKGRPHEAHSQSSEHPSHWGRSVGDDLSRSKRSEHRSRSMTKERSEEGNLDRSRRSEHRSRSVAKERSVDSYQSRRSGQCDDLLDHGSRRSERRDGSRIEDGRGFSKSSHDRNKSSHRRVKDSVRSVLDTGRFLDGESNATVNQEILDTGIITEDQIRQLHLAGFGLHALKFV